MAPILYHLDISPPVRAVLLTAKAIGLELELREVDLKAGGHLTEEFIKINPLHTVPTLDDNGCIICDSHAIAAYLVGRYGKDDSLYPKDLRKRAMVDQKLHFDTGILFTRLRAIFEPILFHGKKEIPKENEDRMIQGYDFMESFLKTSEWLAGSQLTIADLCAVSTISSIVPVILFDAKKYPKLSGWLNKMKALPYYETNEVGAEKIGVAVNQLLCRA